MISHYFNIERSIGSVYTLSGAQATLHAVYHHAMHHMPYYHPIIQFHPPPHSIYQDMYPADFTTIPFGSTYYL
ncbi:hypothetical protein QMA02_14235 [Bacillus wiedmannii]|uniref:hypothetical protein n=1 Tax=Bacillus wiedmannii TaxID=1890302 RepID=UPI0024ACEAAB|nr:hypothetical protein [Bacillus wiedmannii]MDI6677000.1 hypothetical protein [Bacillus wiedmannii]